MNLNYLSDVQDIAVKISDSSLRVFRVLFLGLAGGVVAFAVICFLLYYTNQSKIVGSSADSLYPLLYLMLIVCIPQYLLVFLFPHLFFKKIFEQNKPYLLNKDKDLDIDHALGIIRTHKIILIALLEGCAFFGLVVLIVSITSMLIYSDSIYWLGIIPSLILVLYIFKSLPTKQSLAEEIYKKIVLNLNT